MTVTNPDALVSSTGYNPLFLLASLLFIALFYLLLLPHRRAHWTCVGLYRIRPTLGLTKREQYLILQHRPHAPFCFLYNRIYPDGRQSWRYFLGDEAVYVTTKAVQDRGFTMGGNPLYVED